MCWCCTQIPPVPALDASPLQIDDLFLSTREPFDETKSYRMTAADSRGLAAFMTNVPGLPQGSDVKVPPLLIHVP
jgi:hypothetical protein